MCCHFGSSNNAANCVSTKKGCGIVPSTRWGSSRRHTRQLLGMVQLKLAFVAGFKLISREYFFSAEEWLNLNKYVLQLYGLPLNLMLAAISFPQSRRRWGVKAAVIRASISHNKENRGKSGQTSGESWLMWWSTGLFAWLARQRHRYLYSVNKSQLKPVSMDGLAALENCSVRAIRAACLLENEAGYSANSPGLLKSVSGNQEG